MYRRFGNSVWVLTVALVLLLVFGFSSVASAAAAPASSPVPASSTSTWAYGYVKNTSFGPITTQSGWALKGDWTIGFSVVLNETSTTANSFELSVHRTMGALFLLQYCYPSCSSPTAYVNEYFHEWESIDSFANLTQSGSVLVNGVASPAIALLNSSSYLRANLTNTAESSTVSGGGMVGGLTNRSADVYVSVASNATVDFSPSLGLFPVNLGASPMDWTSNSSFSASGVIHVRYLEYARSSLGMSTVGPVAAQATVFPTGNVSLAGSYNPSASVTFAGIEYPALRLVVNGPFTDREGFILIPDSADLFGGAQQHWSSNETGIAMFSPATLDAKVSANGHFGVAASSWSYDSAAYNAADGLATTTGPTTALGSTADPLGSGTIQGSPLSVPSATGTSNCLATGAGCPAAAPSGLPNLRTVLTGVMAVGVLAVVAAVVAIVLVTERRRLPPPTFPNATLYPPGAAGVAPPVNRTPRPAPSQEPSSEDDPLDHLW